MSSTQIPCKTKSQGLRRPSLNVLKLLKFLPIGAAGLTLSITLSACSAGTRPYRSSLQWQASRSGDPRFAFLEQRDLQDSFQFSATVVASNGLNASVRSLTLLKDIKFSKDETHQKLVAQILQAPGSSNPAEVLFELSLVERAGGLEVDFSSLKQQIHIDEAVSESAQTRFRQINEPEILGMNQTPDSFTTDLRFQFQNEQHASQTAEIVLRVAIVRQAIVIGGQLGSQDRQDSASSLLSQGSRRAAQQKKVKDGLEHGIGYFGVGEGAGNSNGPIKRFALSEQAASQNQIVFHLENFPEWLLPEAIKAVEAWNVAFGANVVRALPARSEVSYGDPRFNVIKWEDEDVGSFVGRATPVLADANGIVYSGNATINGGFINTFLQRYKESRKAFERQRATSASIGTTPFDEIPGEEPFVPFYTGHDLTERQAIIALYKGTIVHELGHIFGLRHNFKASTAPDSSVQNSSVMDYGPRGDISTEDASLGSYDIAAIRWGYFGEEPTEPMVYCSDENLESDWLCNQADFGNPLEFIINAIKGANTFLSEYDNTLSKAFLNNTKTFAQLFLKFNRLKTQMPAREQTRLNQVLIPEFNKLIFETEPDTTSLSANARSNRALVREIGQSFLSCLIDSQQPELCE